MKYLPSMFKALALIPSTDSPNLEYVAPLHGNAKAAWDKMLKRSSGDHRPPKVLIIPLTTYKELKILLRVTKNLLKLR